MLTTTAPSPASSRSQSTEELLGEGRSPNLVKLWALIGGIMLALCVYGWGRWALASELHRSVPTGPDEISQARLYGLYAFQGIFLCLGIYIIGRFLVKPLITERRLTFDGMVVVGALLCWYWDPWTNAFNFVLGYNTHLVNSVSWIRFIPSVPFGNIDEFPEPTVLGVTYITWIVASALFGCAIMRAIARRWPTMSKFARYSVIFWVFFVLDFIIEGILVVRVLEVWNYIGVIEEFTLWSDHSYQFPLYEPVTAGIWGVMFTYLRHTRDDRGRSFVERGADDLRISERGKTFVRFLCVTGACQATVFLLYVPWAAIMVNANSSPPDTPSYMRDQVCGEGTDYACPDELVPIPKTKSIHITPDDPRLAP